MLGTATIEALKAMAPDNIKFNEPLKNHTTFKLGGEADVFISVKNIDELKSIVSLLNKVGTEFLVIGRGSNLLVSDKGYRGVVLYIGDDFADVTVNGNCITALAGASLSKVARVALENSLTGLEFAAGIPGSVGGAIVMNAGAYGSEMKDVVKEVALLNYEAEEMLLYNSSMAFGYRTSAVKNKNFIVTSVTFECTSGKQDEIKSKMNELAEMRRSKQPLEFPSAGSTFKRPEGYFAGKLIQDAGLRGFQIGGARVSDKHCGFVVNMGYATAMDVKDLIDEVTETVYEKFQVKLEPEVIMIGDF